MDQAYLDEFRRHDSKQVCACSKPKIRDGMKKRLVFGRKIDAFVYNRRVFPVHCSVCAVICW